MEKMTTIICAHCGEQAEKQLKEIKRQKKNGRKAFYCSQKCSGHVITPNRSKWNNSDKNKKRLIKQARCDNRIDKYTIIREHLRKVNNRIKDNSRHTETDLNLDYLLELWDKQEGKCAYTGVTLIPPKSGAKGNKQIDKNYQASLDRIDNSIGYLKGNVQFISVTVNWLKNDLDDKHISDFFKIVRNIA